MSQPDPSIARSTVVDAHAHHFPSSLSAFAATSGEVLPSLIVDGDRSGRIMIGERVFRAVDSQLWDVAHRVQAMDEAGVRLQVVSPVPVMLTYGASAEAAQEYSAAVNDALAADVDTSGGRLVGLGTVALQNPTGAAAELERLMRDLGLRGVEIGTTIAGTELDDPSLTPFWEAAERLGAAVFIHPVGGGGGAVRRTGQLYDFGMGMLTDTSMAATALVFGGVLEEFPRLRIGLAHGCGAFGWVYPRLRKAHEVWGSGPVDAVDERMRSLWVDTLVLDPEHLRLLVHRFGADKVMVGTDHPFFPDLFTAAGSFVREAAGAHILDDDVVERILSVNATGFLGLPAVSATV
ncbi:amidohydrolase family protein [Gordonia polyisoprenivorans]|uniref:amidohydrolase family protein n=1 Tax=Gordonia polyisoprenivorans TaxID=84595 RepID=UPI001AD76346|nr:amidohydrolase family protein [Gordonia polyisoprenivorans]QTI69918.1 amidohydrolase [Gordonia polyisoprenivorans]